MTADRIDTELHTRIAKGLVSSSEALVLLDQIKDVRAELHTDKVALEEAALSIQSLRSQAARAEAELAAKTSALRALDPEEVARQIADAVSFARGEAVAAVAKELAGLRSEVARLRSVVDELRLSKRKLREALSRVKETP